MGVASLDPFHRSVRFGEMGISALHPPSMVIAALHPSYAIAKHVEIC